MSPSNRLISLTRALSHYATHPRNLPEIQRWWRDRNPQLQNPTPWCPYEAVDAVAAALPPDGDVFEFGGGGSTAWLCERANSVTAVEHDAAWAKEIERLVKPNGHVLLVKPGSKGTVLSPTHPGVTFDQYVSSINTVPDETLSLVIVDGRARVACGLAAMSKVKPGGMLLLDDSNRPQYQPLRDALRAWPSVDYRGLKPGGKGVCQTTIWTRADTP